MKNLINLKSAKEIGERLKKEKSVAVIFHIRPDGDAIGSAVALYLGLNKIGVNTQLFCADVIPSKFFFLPETDKIRGNIVGDFSAMVSVDCGEINRMGDFAEVFDKHPNSYNIDHHISNTRFAKINYVCDNPSNSENVFEILNEIGVEIDSVIANYLLMGLITDTGGFRHKGVKSSSFVKAGALVEKGADPNAIYFNCFSRQSKNRATLYGNVVSKIRYFLDDRLAVASVFQKDLEKSGAKVSDTEGIIDFVMGIDGVEVGVCVLETSVNKFKISFRGKDTDVNAIALTFGGGGHKFASGCQLQGEYEEVVDRICYAVKVNLRD